MAAARLTDSTDKIVPRTELKSIELNFISVINSLQSATGGYRIEWSKGTSYTHIPHSPL